MCCHQVFLRRAGRNLTSTLLVQRTTSKRWSACVNWPSLKRFRHRKFRSRSRSNCPPTDVCGDSHLSGCISSAAYALPPSGFTSAKPKGSFLWLRVDRLATLEHLDEGLDLLLPPGLGLHVVDPEGQCEAVLRAEFPQHCPGLGLGVDG